MTFLALGIYAQALLPGRTFIADVLFRAFLGQSRLLKQALSHGELPFWNPYMSSGTPVLANAQSSLFYPGTYVFALFDFGLALKIHVVAHALLACFFMTLLARSLGMKAWPARLAGMVYAFNGFAVLHFQLPPHLQVYAWTPLTVYSLRQAVLQKTRASFVSGVLSLALLFFCGYVPFMVYAVMIAFAIAMGTNQGAWSKRVVSLGLLGGVAVMLATVQIGPLLQFALQSSRAAGSGQGWVLAKSLEWREMARMTFCPLWDWYLHFNTDIGITGLYWGYPVLILAAVAVWRARTSSLCRVLLGLFFLGIILSAGGDGLLYPLLARYVWPFGWLRYPANALLLSNFAIALLAGMGMERFSQRSYIGWILVCVLDLGLFAQRAYETIETSFYRETPPTATYLQQHEDGTRIFMTPPSAARMGRYGNTRYEAYVHFADSIMPNYATVFRLHDAGGGEELRFERYRRVLAEVEKARRSPWLNILGVRYILSFWPVPDARKVWQGPSGIQVFENNRAFPRAYFVPQAVYAPAEFAFRDISNGRLDLRNCTILNDPSATPPIGKPSPYVPLPVVELSPNRLRVPVQAAQAGWVVLSDSFDRGWQVRDGNGPVHVFRTNYVQQAVPVRAGHTDLEWRYRPQGWNAMVAMSLATAVFLVCFGTMRKEDKL
jgi:hypothetical protein